MKKIFYNSNLYILLLAPIFILALLGLFYQSINLELPNVTTEVVGLFNKKTIFQVLCEVVESRAGGFVSN